MEIPPGRFLRISPWFLTANASLMFAEGTARGYTHPYPPPYIVSGVDKGCVPVSLKYVPRGTANSADNRFPSPTHRVISGIRRGLVCADFVPSAKLQNEEFEVTGVKRNF